MAKRNILIVDDEPEIRHLVRTILEGAIAEVLVLESDNGADALVKLANQRFDLLITDFSMPKIDGKRLLEELAALPKSQRPAQTIMMSAFSAPQGTNFKNIYFIAKPFQVEFFTDLVIRCLEVESTATERAPKIDVAFINPFVEATLKVLAIMANTQAQKNEVFIRKRDQPSGDISAIISMNSNKFMGSMAISFEASCFLGIVQEMLCEKFETITPDISDAAGELCNQIFGQAKVTLNGQGHQIQPAIPSVILGEQHTIQHLIQGPCIAISFSTQWGRFSVETVVQILTP